MSGSDSDGVGSAIKARKGTDGQVAKIREQFEPFHVPRSGYCSVSPIRARGGSQSASESRQKWQVSRGARRQPHT